MASTSCILDTDITIQWLRGDPAIIVRIGDIIRGRNLLYWTPISVAEIYAGMRPGEEARLDQLFLVFSTLSLTPEIGKKAGDYLRKYSKSHGLEIADAMQAAASFHYRLPLWTLNKRHYPMKDISLL